jgi:hypothetical protein
MYKRNAGLTTVRYFEGLQKHIKKGDENTKQELNNIKEEPMKPRLI